MITYQVEPFTQMAGEMLKNLAQKHWEELALDKEKVPLALDLEKYIKGERDGYLHVLTVRDDGRLVGYFMGMVIPHLHYKDAGMMAHTDVYYLLPEYRNGIGVKMFAELEKSLRARGVVKIYLSTKVHQDHSALFEALGYRLTDKVFTKMIGGA